MTHSFLVLPLWALVLGAFVSWRLGENAGRGDLRLYALVQFYPILAIPLLLALFPPRYTRTLDLLLSLAWYGAAKLNEALDARIFGWTGHAVSGHTLKHLAAAMGLHEVLRMLSLRRAVG